MFRISARSSLRDIVKLFILQPIIAHQTLEDRYPERTMLDPISTVAKSRIFTNRITPMAQSGSRKADLLEELRSE